MKIVCGQCHGRTWVDAHYVKLDKVVEEYNEVYFKPAKKMLDDLYEKGLLDKTKFYKCLFIINSYNQAIYENVIN